MLFKLYNSSDFGTEWQWLNAMQVLTSRQQNFVCLHGNQFKVGINALMNRLHILNGKITLGWVNLEISTFKIKCKKLLL